MVVSASVVEVVLEVVDVGEVVVVIGGDVVDVDVVVVNVSWLLASVVVHSENKVLVA